MASEVVDVTDDRGEQGVPVLVLGGERLCRPLGVKPCVKHGVIKPLLVVPDLPRPDGRLVMNGLTLFAHDVFLSVSYRLFYGGLRYPS